MSLSLEPIKKLQRDLRDASATLSEKEARYLVDGYYILQESRKRASNQLLAMEGEPHATLQWFYDQAFTLEKETKKALAYYASSHLAGEWAQTITGIGPVISAGLLAHIDVTKARTAGAVWRFAGLDPTSKWNKGEKRPWNASLKVLAWKIGESFVKVSGRDSDIYGKVYLERKALEIERNEQGLFATQAAETLESKKIGKSTDAYKHYTQGQLPPARIHARAKRYAVKLFLAHYFEVAYEIEHGVKPPKPYIIEHGGHTHYLAPPNWPLP